MLGQLSERKETVFKNLGYFLIWGDFYLLFFGAHALLVSTVNCEDHIRTYLSVFVPLCEWFSSLNSFTEGWINFVFGLPAVGAYFGRFILSTSIGVWLVRRAVSLRRSVEP